MKFLDNLKVTLPNLPKALCADPSIPADVFHPQGKTGYDAVLETVQEICNACPEKAACLEYAVSEQIFDGIWAGTTGHERKIMAGNARKGRNGKKVTKLVPKTTRALQKDSSSWESLQ